MGVLDQLVGVAVARDDDHVVTAVAALGGQRGDDVVGLEADLFEHRDLEALDHPAHQAHLLAQDVGRLGPPRLVGGDHVVSEGGFGPVEGHRDVVGVVVLQQVDQHRREAEHGVGHLARGRRHVRREGEECPVGQ